MNKLELQQKVLDKVITKIAVFQVLALVLYCCIGMYLTTKEMFFETIYIVPFHYILLFIIIRLNKKWLKQVEEM